MTTTLTHLRQMTMDDLAPVWNEYAGEECEGSVIHRCTPWSYDNIFYGMSPSDIVYMLMHGDFNKGDEWFCLDKSGYIESFSTIEDSPIDIDVLAGYISKNKEYFKQFNL